VVSGVGRGIGGDAACFQITSVQGGISSSVALVDAVTQVMVGNYRQPCWCVRYLSADDNIALVVGVPVGVALLIIIIIVVVVVTTARRRGRCCKRHPQRQVCDDNAYNLADNDRYYARRRPPTSDAETELDNDRYLGQPLDNHTESTLSPDDFDLRLAADL